MPEHVHLMLRPDPDVADATEVCRAIKQPVARRLPHRWRTLDARVLHRLAVSQDRHRFWQAGGGFDRNVRDEDELLRELWYIHANPVSRGLVDHPSQWAWSSARGYLGLDDRVPLDADERVVEWMRKKLIAESERSQERH
jgi:putative transposase